MATVFTPICPGSGPWYIDREDCIGDSLVYINANTGYLDCKINSLSSSTNTQINSLSTVPYARLNDGNQTGDAPIFGARAWVNFDGTRNNSGVSNTSNTDRFIRGQGNVSSVLRNGEGIYTVNLTIPMSNTNYVVHSNVGAAAGNGPPTITLVSSSITTTSFQLQSFASSSNAADRPIIMVTVFG